MNSTLVSVIIPTYNRAYILMDAVKSILSQTYRNWEILIVDDGSSDNTESLIASIGDPRIRFYRQANKGPSAARNHGVARAKGEWIVYLDSDDVLYPNYLEVMLVWLRNNPKAVYAIPRADRMLELYQNNRLIKSINDSDDIPEDVSTKDIFMKRFHFSCDGFIHKRGLFDGTIQWDEKLRHMEEWDLAMQIGERYPDGFLFVPITLYCYHQRHGTDGVCSNTPYLEWADAFEYIYRKHQNDRMLEGQDWYPERVEKWTKIHEEWQRGILPPPQLFFFPEFFNSPRKQSVAA